MHNHTFIRNDKWATSWFSGLNHFDLIKLFKYNDCINIDMMQLDKCDFSTNSKSCLNTIKTLFNYWKSGCRWFLPFFALSIYFSTLALAWQQLLANCWIYNKYDSYGQLIMTSRNTWTLEEIIMIVADSSKIYTSGSPTGVRSHLFFKNW